MKPAKTLFFVFLSAFLCSVCLSGTGWASEKPPAPTVGKASEAPDYGSSPPINIQSTVLLKSVESKITKLTGNAVSIEGWTETYSDVDAVTVKLYLQGWNPQKGVWEDIYNAGTFTEYNDHYVYQQKKYEVTGGNYYRTRAVHIAKDGGLTEEIQTVTDYIYVE